MKQSTKAARAKAALLFLIGLLLVNFSQATVISYARSGNGVRFKLDKGVMFLRICRADIIEVKYSMLDTLAQKKSLVVNNPWKESADFTVADRSGEVLITTARLHIKINKSTNAITYTDLKGKVITAETSKNKTMQAQPLPA